MCRSKFYFFWRPTAKASWFTYHWRGLQANLLPADKSVSDKFKWFFYSCGSYSHVCCGLLSKIPIPLPCEISKKSMKKTHAKGVFSSGLQPLFCHLQKGELIPLWEVAIGHELHFCKGLHDVSSHGLYRSWHFEAPPGETNIKFKIDQVSKLFYNYHRLTFAQRPVQPYLFLYHHRLATVPLKDAGLIGFRHSNYTILTICAALHQGSNPVHGRLSLFLGGTSQ